MDVWKMAGVCEFTQPLVCQTIAVRPLQGLQADDADHAALIDDGPCLKFAGLRFLQSLLKGHRRAQYFRGIAHRMSHLALPFLLARSSHRQVDAVLGRKALIDRLFLKPQEMKKLTRLEIISGTTTA